MNGDQKNSDQFYAVLYETGEVEYLRGHKDDVESYREELSAIWYKPKIVHVTNDYNKKLVSELRRCKIEFKDARQAYLTERMLNRPD